MIIIGSAAFAAPFPSKSIDVDLSEFTVLPLVSRNFPISTLASCTEIERSIALFNTELARLKAEFTGVGKEVLGRVAARRTELEAAIRSAKALEAAAQIDEAFAQINLGLNLVFLTLGCTLAAPVAVGIAAGTSVLTGAATFAIQAYYKKNTSDPLFIIGYSRDRALMFADLGSADAASSAGRLLNSTVRAAALLVSGYEVYKTTNEKASARASIISAVSALDAVDKKVKQFGTNTASWANIYQKHLVAARDALQKFVDATRKNNCQLERVSERKP